MNTQSTLPGYFEQHPMDFNRDGVEKFHLPEDLSMVSGSPPLSCRNEACEVKATHS